MLNKPINYFKYIFPVLVLTFIGLAVLITRPSPKKMPPIDDSILSQYDCTFPCWQDLIPGQTSLQEAQSALPNIQFASDSLGGIGASEGVGTDSRYYIGWTNLINESGGSLGFENDILRTILIRPNINFTLQDILTRYGQPDAWAVTHDTGGGDVSFSYVKVHLYYINYGLVAEFEIYDGFPNTIFTIRPDAKGLQFWLVPSSTSLSQMLMNQTGLSAENTTSMVNDTFITGWRGLYSQITDITPYDAILSHVLTVIPSPLYSLPFVTGKIAMP